MVRVRSNAPQSSEELVYNHNLHDKGLKFDKHIPYLPLYMI